MTAHNFQPINPPLREGQGLVCSGPKHESKYGSAMVYERDEPMADLAAPAMTFYCKACRDKESLNG